MQKQIKKTANAGFTLIEILVVIGMIALLAAIVIVAINPARQFAQGRDTQRTSNVNAILNAIGQRMADNKGIFQGLEPASGKYCGTLSNSSTTINWVDNATSTANGLDCLVPTYISVELKDPQPDAALGDYKVWQDDATHRITVAAPSAEINKPISITR